MNGEWVEHIWRTNISQEEHGYSTKSCMRNLFTKVKFNWTDVLTEIVLKFYDLFAREINSSTDLQMSTLLPFVASCIGPQTKGLLLTKTF